MNRYRSCGAMYRERFNDPGWTCDGTGLIKLLDGLDGIPVVAPEERLDEMRKVEKFWAALDPEPFTGGDHYHLVLF